MAHFFSFVSLNDLLENKNTIAHHFHVASSSSLLTQSLPFSLFINGQKQTCDSLSVFDLNLGKSMLVRK